MTPEQIAAQQIADMYTKADAEKKINTFQNQQSAMTLPSELTSIEDWANQQLNAPTPQFNPAQVAEYQKTMQPATDYQKKQVTKNANNAFASLFPEGGGSTFEASKLTDALEGIDAQTLAEANTFAQAQQQQAFAADQSNKSSARGALSGIAGAKTQASQFASSQDTANYWNEIAAGLGETNLFEGQGFQREAYDKNAALASSLADKYASSQPNPWMNVFNSLAGGVGTGVGAALAL